jgi:hypothetical protein
MNEAWSFETRTRERLDSAARGVGALTYGV